MKELELIFSKHLPQTIEEGKLYISKEYGISKHLCPCGCKSLIVIPFAENVEKDLKWAYTEIDGKVSFKPSMGNWQLPCKSHYYITDNKFVM